MLFKRLDLAQDVEVVGKRLAETEPRVDDHPGAVHALFLQPGDTSGQETVDLRDHVLVVRSQLHVAGGAEPMHDHHPAAGVAHHRHHRRVVAQGRDVVDQVGALLERGPGHRCLGGVDGYRHCAAAAHRPHRRQHPGQFLGLAHRLGKGPGRLAADIDQVRALGEQLVDAGRERVLSLPAAAVGNGIWGDVDNTHDLHGCSLLRMSGDKNGLSPPGEDNP